MGTIKCSAADEYGARRRTSTARCRRPPPRGAPPLPASWLSWSPASTGREGARWSTHARATTACKRPRSRSVVRTPEPRGERAMGAALTLWVRHAGTRSQSNTHAARGLTVRRSPSIGANTSWCHSARDVVFARLGAGVTSVRPAGGASVPELALA